MILENDVFYRTAIEKWSMECLAKLGYFCDACFTLPGLIGSLPVKYVLNIFSLLSGKGLPAGTQLVASFNQSSEFYTLACVKNCFLLMSV